MRRTLPDSAGKEKIIMLHSQIRNEVTKVEGLVQSIREVGYTEDIVNLALQELADLRESARHLLSLSESELAALIRANSILVALYRDRLRAIKGLLEPLL